MDPHSIAQRYFEQPFRNFVARVRPLARRAPPGTTEDEVASEVRAKMYRLAHELAERGESPERILNHKYATVVAKNVVRTLFRKHNQRREAPLEGAEIDGLADGSQGVDPVKVAMQNEELELARAPARLLRAVQAALCDMDEWERTVFHCYHHPDKLYAKVKITAAACAEELKARGYKRPKRRKITKDTVQEAYSRALAIFKAHLGKQFKPGA